MIMTDQMTKFCQVMTRAKSIRLHDVEVGPNTKLRRNLTATEIKRCLTAGAYVTEILKDGTKVQLNFQNFLYVADEVKKEEKVAPVVTPVVTVKKTISTPKKEQDAKTQKDSSNLSKD